MNTKLVMIRALSILGLSTVVVVSSSGAAISRCQNMAEKRLTEAAVAIELTTPSGQPAHGSGIVWDRLGHIVTNHHVIAAGVSPIITFASGARYSGTVIADAPERDIAVIRVSDAPSIGLNTAVDVSVRGGEPVLAIGNPFGHGMSLISGTLEASGQQIMIPPGIALTGLFQTDLPFKPGNSGGPVFDCAGNLIGMAAATMPRNTGMGITGYVIPASHLAAVVASIVSESTITPASSRSIFGGRPGLGLMVVSGSNGMLVVDRVIPGSPAAMAGASAGDMIARLNGRPVYTVTDLSEQVQRDGIGGSVMLTISRDGRSINLPIRIMSINFSS